MSSNIKLNKGEGLCYVPRQTKYACLGEFTVMEGNNRSTMEVIGYYDNESEALYFRSPDLFFKFENCPAQEMPSIDRFETPQKVAAKAKFDENLGWIECLANLDTGEIMLIND